MRSQTMHLMHTCATSSNFAELKKSLLTLYPCRGFRMQGSDQMESR